MYELLTVQRLLLKMMCSLKLQVQVVSNKTYIIHMQKDILSFVASPLWGFSHNACSLKATYVSSRGEFRCHKSVFVFIIIGASI